jgi:hypothetical protein
MTRRGQAGGTKANNASRLSLSETAPSSTKTFGDSQFFRTRFASLNRFRLHHSIAIFNPELLPNKETTQN